MRISLSDKDKEFCFRVTDELIRFWKFHRRFDANIKSLAEHASVSRDTVYRWLNRKALPKLQKARLVDEWLRKRNIS